MPTIHELLIEPLTEEAFAPFGQIISTKERAPDFRTESGTEAWAIDFHSGRPLVMVLRTPYQGLRFSGYALAPGTWHSLDRFPLYPPDTRWVIITDHETQQDLLTAYGGTGGWELTQEADYRGRFDLVFTLALDR